MLEKILEETERIINMHYEDDSVKAMILRNLRNVRKHMNDGWIPCEERMPEKSGHYLVQLSEKMSSEDYSDMTVVLYEEEFEEFLSYSSWILAWRPLPEPYRPEKGE